MRCSPGIGVLAIGLLLGGALPPAQAQMQGFDDAKVQQAIEKGKTYLLSAQLENGSWSEDKTTGVGLTAMSAYALIECGIKPNDERIKKSLTWLKEQKCNHTYSLGLRCQAYLSAEKHGAKGHRFYLKKDADVLVRTGLANHGRYGYESPGEGKDNSNSQYGLLGVWAAADLGTIEIRETYWTEVMKHWQGCQGPDGGWIYQFSKPAPGGAAATMTAAGIASVLVCYEQLTVNSFIDCKGPTRVPTIEHGLDWMERYFVEIVGGAPAVKAAQEAETKRKAEEAEETKKILAEMTPEDRRAFLIEEKRREQEEKSRQRPADEKRGFAAPGGWMLYFLYGIERFGLASGYKYFGTADWYKLGAEHIVSRQQANGSWGALHDTAFAMIYLVRGRNPVLFNKLAYRGRWKNRPHDLLNLTKWISESAEWTVNWQSINANVPVREWHDAPILYIAGSTAPYFTPIELRKLRRYVEEGGTILSVTECDGDTFRKGMKNAYKRIFPEHELIRVDPRHEMHTAPEMLPVADGKAPAVSMISNGVRPLAVQIDADLPKFWQLRRLKAPEAAFEIGSNLAQYIAGLSKELRPRGASPWPERTSQPMTGKEIRIARLKHSGNYNPEPLAYDRFSLLMANRHQVPVVVGEPIDIQNLTADRAHLAVLAGAGELTLTVQETAALKKFVTDGGTLLVEALGGNGDFGKTAQAALRETFEAEPAQLSPTHRLYRIQGFEVNQFRYRKRTTRRVGRDAGPRLEAIVAQGRPAVFFSREDLSCGLLGYQGLAIEGYSPETAFELVRNIALLASGQERESPASGPASQPTTAPETQPAK